MDMMLREAVSVAKREGEEILDGRISVAPYDGTCTYCPYSNACGMDRKVPGYKYRSGSKLKRKDAVSFLCAKYADGTEGTDDEKGGADNGV
jgi:ATP-dependent helicase/nuclease subunit B